MIDWMAVNHLFVLCYKDGKVRALLLRGPKWRDFPAGASGIPYKSARNPTLGSGASEKAFW